MGGWEGGRLGVGGTSPSASFSLKNFLGVSIFELGRAWGGKVGKTWIQLSSSLFHVRHRWKDHFESVGTLNGPSKLATRQVLLPLKSRDFEVTGVASSMRGLGFVAQMRLAALFEGAPNFLGGVTGHCKENTSFAGVPIPALSRTRIFKSSTSNPKTRFRLLKIAHSVP